MKLHIITPVTDLSCPLSTLGISLEDGEYYVDLSTVKQLTAFLKNVGKCIIIKDLSRGKYTVEIYNDWG